MSSNCTGKFKTELDFHAGTRSYQKLYKLENIGYVEVPDDHLYNRYGYMKAYFCDVRMACLGAYRYLLLLLLMFFLRSYVRTW